ncbi:MAG: hypothetical protein N2510_09945, partial [Ignavibacteria bacterium]|nr:hypothetical protein [Ignavibacteria bacterium]
SHALRLSDLMIKEFMDSGNYGFFDTYSNKNIVVRTKEDYDSAEPTGNSVAIYNLLRLSYITGDEKFYDIAIKSLESFSDKMKKIPYAMPQMLISLDYYLNKPMQIIITGSDKVADEMTKAVFRKFIPGKILIRSPKSDSITFAGKLVREFTSAKAYVCENFSCKLPVDTVEKLEKLI